MTFNFWWSPGLVEPHLPLLSSHSFLDYQFLVIRVVHRTLQPKKKCSITFFLILVDGLTPFNFWMIWPGSMVEPHLPPLSSHSFLDDFQLLAIARAGQWTWTSATTLQPKKWNAHFWITFNFWWLAGLVHRLKPYPPHLSSQKNEMLIFGLRSGWLAGLVNGLEPHLPPLSSQKNKMLIFGLHSTSDDRPGWSMDLNPICHPSPAKKIKCSFFGLRSTSDDRPGWSMDWNPIRHSSPAKKIKFLF